MIMKRGGRKWNEMIKKSHFFVVKLRLETILHGTFGNNLRFSKVFSPLTGILNILYQ